MTVVTLVTMCKKCNRLPHQKSRFFIASKEVAFTLAIWPSRKALKGLLQNVYLMLDLLYHEWKPLIMTVVNVNTF